MDCHSKTYEQFCWVKQKNIIMEETVFHNGTRKVICTNLTECEGLGGCKNKSLCRLWRNPDTIQNRVCCNKCEELTNGK